MQKIGTKWKIDNNFALSPYYTIGGNLIEVKGTPVLEGKQRKIGLSTGIGLEMIIKEYFFIAAEYRYTSALFDNFGGYKRPRIKTHNLMIKLGYHFL